MNLKVFWSFLLFFFSSALVFAQALDGTDKTFFTSIDKFESEVSTSAGAAHTKLDTLLEWYKLGAPLSFSDFRGYYSGRCFRRSSPNSARNSMIGYLDFGSYGPGFDDVKIFAIRNLSQSADYFDNGEQAQSNIKLFEKIGNDGFDHISKIIQTPNLGYKYDHEPNGKFDEMFQYVTYNGYIVAKWTALVKRKYGKEGILNPGDTIGSCYYFKKLGE